MSERIRIDYSELEDPRIDAILERERAIRAIAARTQVSFWRKFFFSSMLYTAIVGAIGGLLGWALLEPYFEDLVTITGSVKESLANRGLAPCEKCRKVQSLDVDRQGGGKCPGCGAPLTQPKELAVHGMIKLERTDVYLLPGGTRLIKDGQRETLRDAGQIPVGSRVRLRAQVEDDKDAFDHPVAIASSVELDPAPRPGGDPGEPDLRQIAKNTRWSSMLFFAVVGGMIALMVGATEGVVSLNLRQAILCGGIGAGIGFVGGLVGILPAGMIYSAAHVLTRSLLGNTPVMTIHDMHGGALLAQIVGRSLAWGAVGAALALGQGLARRSGKLAINGLLGGCLGGLFGGLLFDPIGKLVAEEGAELSRCIGFSTVGLLIGLLIGVVEQLSKEAWLLMRSGILAGKQFVVHKSPTTIGSLSLCDVYLFKDPDVAAEHARLVRIGRAYEIEDLNTPSRTLVNGSPVQRRILRDGDQITIGGTILEYRSRGA